MITTRTRRLALGAATTAAVTAAVGLTAVAPAQAKIPDHHTVVCDQASFYQNYDSSTGPSNKLRDLYRGNDIGHDRGAHPVYNGWAAAHHYSSGQWGYIRIECIS